MPGRLGVAVAKTRARERRVERAPQPLLLDPARGLEVCRRTVTAPEWGSTCLGALGFPGVDSLLAWKPNGPPREGKVKWSMWILFGNAVRIHLLPCVDTRVAV